MDLFVVPTIGFDLLYAFVIVRLDRRDLVWICKSASHLTPYRRPTLTPPMALEILGTTKEISSWLGSQLDADRDQSSEPIHKIGRP